MEPQRNTKPAPGPTKGRESIYVRKRACLGGKDLAKLLKGEMALSNGIEFVYDGSDVPAVKEAVNDLTQASKHDKR